MEKSGRGGNWHYGLMRAFSREWFRQGVSIFTLICFVPFSLQPWNFAAWADTPASGGTGLAPLSLALVPEPALPVAPQPISSESPFFKEPTLEQGEEITNPEYWVRVARVLPSDSERVHEDLDTLLAKAYTVRSPKAKTEGENSKPDLRRYRPDAKPAPQQAAETTAPPAATETGTAMEKAAVSEARTVLERGDMLLQENRPREAMQAYFEVVDGWPESPESDALDNVVNALAWDAEAHAVDPLELLAFVDGLPAYAECHIISLPFARLHRERGYGTWLFCVMGHKRKGDQIMEVPDYVVGDAACCTCTCQCACNCSCCSTAASMSVIAGNSPGSTSVTGAATSVQGSPLQTTTL